MASLYLHEAQKLVNDLIAHQEYELAFQVSGVYAAHFEDGYLGFAHLWLPLRMDLPERTLQILEDSLSAQTWFSSWFIKRSGEFGGLEGDPRFQAILKELDALESDYWQRGTMQPVVRVPETGQASYPLVVAMHGNGFSSQHMAQNMACAVDQGWLLVCPLSPHLVGYGLHWWEAHEETRKVVEEQVNEAIRGAPADTERVLLAGFSKGGEVAEVMALQGAFHARGFVTVGSGGYLHSDPEKWRALMENAPRGLRGVVMYSPYDLDRVGEDLTKILAQYQEYGIQVKLVEYPGVGHVFPVDFDRRFQDAVQFICEGQADSLAR